jgi:hypothetical protein
MPFELAEPDTPEWTAYFANHVGWYMFAAERLKEVGASHVPDAAWGVGYGTRYLAAASRSVVGADRDRSAVRISGSHFAHSAVASLADEPRGAMTQGRDGPSCSSR